MALMNEIFVARNEFAAVLTSSAVAKSVIIRGVSSARIDAYTSSRVAAAACPGSPSATP